jgi:nucleoside-diphosphate-sugar epimerase
VKTALVTGSAGFIGRHMTRHLAAAGYAVQGIDVMHPIGGDPGWTTVCDARDWFRSATGPFDVVVHAAAVVGGREVIDGPPLALAVNLELDAAMFAWAARTRPGRVVYLSSSAVYPVALQHHGARPLREDDADPGAPQLPDQLYGWCKLTGEQLARRAAACGLAVTVARPFSGYGEDQDDCYPFAAFAARARAREDPFVIWGDGRQVRDWIHVDDICAAILAMIAAGAGGPVNLGTGRAVSMRELAGLMCAAAGYQPQVKTLPEMPAGVPCRVAGTAAMRRFHVPRISLEDGVMRAVAHA